MQTQKKQASVDALFEAVAANEKKMRAELSKSGKLTARARLEALFDEQSFTEIGAFNSRTAGNPADSDRIVAGYGAVDGRLVFAFSQEFSQELGAFGEAAAKKICSLYELAVKKGSPIIAMLDSNGAKLEEDVSLFASYGTVIKKAAESSGVIPQIAVVCGVCSGALALFAGNCDFIIACENNSSMFLNSPAKIKSLNKAREDFSTAYDTAANGISAITCSNEDQAIFSAKKLLSFLPSNNEDGAPNYDQSDDVNRKTACFSGADTSIAFDAASVLADLADSGDVFELYSGFAPELKTGFFTLGGQSCGFIANDPTVSGGKLTANACKKASRMVDFCNLFDITVINLINTEGFDAENEANGNLITPASELALAYSLCEAPVITLVVGKAYGSAFAALASKELGADVVFALPYAEISILSPETGVSFLWNDKFADVKDAISGRNELIAKWRQDNTSPVAAAACGLIDDIIRPEEARQRLISAVYMLNK